MKKLFVRMVRPGMTLPLEQWGQSLMQRKSEVLASLIEENVQHESAYLVHTDHGDFFVAVMESNEAIGPANMTRDINQEHVKILRECLFPPLPCNELYSFDLI